MQCAKKAWRTVTALQIQRIAAEADSADAVEIERIDAAVAVRDTEH